MVGVRENLAAHIPCFGPCDAFFVNQDAHQLGNRQHGVGVVQVDGDFVGKVFDAGETAFVARHDVLYGCGNQEIFLFQAQLAAAVGGVVRIEDARDVFIAVLRADGGSVIAAVEICQVEAATGVSRPQAQRIGDVAAVAGDDFIVCHRGNFFARMPFFFVTHIDDLSAEADGVLFVRAADLPCQILVEPQIGFFDLLAVHDFLFEHTVLIADAVAHGGNAQGGERVEEAGGQAAQTAVAQAGVLFLFADVGELFTQLFERLFKFGIHAFVNQSVDESASQQEFHRKVVNHAFAVVDVGAAGLQEVFGNQVARGEHGGVEPLVFGRLFRIDAQNENQFIDDGLADGFGIRFRHDVIKT